MGLNIVFFLHEFKYITPPLWIKAVGLFITIEVLTWLLIGKTGSERPVREKLLEVKEITFSMLLWILLLAYYYGYILGGKPDFGRGSQ